MAKKKLQKKLQKPTSAKGEKDLNVDPAVPTEFVCVIDRSGSMQPIQDDAIGGFNTFLKEQQEMPGKAFLTMVLFDHEYILVHNGTPITDVKPLDHTTYVPRGMTSLFDAIGRAITSVRERYEKPEATPTRVMVVILTDGRENNSTEYNREQIADMIKFCRDDLKWAFLYLSASESAFTDASSIGIHRDGAASFHRTHAGGQCVGQMYGMAAMEYRTRGTVGSTASYAARIDPKKQNLNVDQDLSARS